MSVIAVGLLGMAAPAGAGTPPLPVISNQVFIVTNTTFAGGAYGNGSSNSAAAINAAITYASGHGGGTVEIPAVTGGLTNYMSGPITMASHVNLQIDSGAMLQMFPLSTWTNRYGTSTPPFVSASGLTDIEISGSGTMDGQGTNWWVPVGKANEVPRPNFIDIGGCTRVLIQNVKLQNPPTFTIYMKSSDTSVTIQGITIDTPFDSHNTDAFDITSTNVLIQNCHISTGDDDAEIGGTGAAATDITISNCWFGTGHGVSIGSYTGGGVNNLLVSNCTWVGTEYGIKMKTQRGRGGLMENLKYCDMTMTNVNFPFAFYMAYDSMGSPSKNITNAPAGVAADPGQAITGTTPIFRNVTISNLKAWGNSGIQGPGNIAGMIFGLPESPISNVTLSGVNISGRSSDGTIDIYNARGIQIIDSNLTAPLTGTNVLTLYNAQVTVTNSVANTNWVTITGLGSPSNSVLSLFNGQAGTRDASVLGASPLLTLAGSTLTVSNNMSVGSSSSLNYGLGTNATKTVVTGNLTLGGTLNVADGGGFNTGTYSLFTYGGTLTYNTLTVGAKPNINFAYQVDTNTIGVVKLDVTSSCSVGAAGPISGSTSVASGTNGVSYSISSVSGATTYAWTVPSGASIASGQGTTSITVNYGCSAVSGNVTVTPSNGSCNGTLSSQVVTVTAVGVAGSISGLSAVCSGQAGASYSISSVSGATTYTWAVPSGASIAGGQGSTSITVNWGASSGNVT
ncbi:MAG: glycosyl hydrolase family 28 protein, partial [Verrucomicrobiia bacterium]